MENYPLSFSATPEQVNQIVSHMVANGITEGETRIVSNILIVPKSASEVTVKVGPNLVGHVAAAKSSLGIA